MYELDSRNIIKLHFKHLVIVLLIADKNFNLKIKKPNVRKKNLFDVNFIFDNDCIFVS